MKKVNMLVFRLSVQPKKDNKKSYICHDDIGKVVICAGDFAAQENAPELLFAIKTANSKRIERDRYALWTGLEQFMPEMLKHADVATIVDELENVEGCNRAHEGIYITKYRDGEILYVSGRGRLGCGHCHLFYRQAGELFHGEFDNDEFWVDGFFDELKGCRGMHSDPRFPQHKHNIECFPLRLTDLFGDCTAVHQIMEKGPRRLVLFSGMSYIFSEELEPTLFRNENPSRKHEYECRQNLSSYSEIPLTDRIWEIDEYEALAELAAIPTEGLGLEEEESVVRNAILSDMIAVARFTRSNSQCAFLKEKGIVWWSQLSRSERETILNYVYDFNTAGREQAIKAMRDEFHANGNLSYGWSRIRAFYSLYR